MQFSHLTGEQVHKCNIPKKKPSIPLVTQILAIINRNEKREGHVRREKRTHRNERFLNKEAFFFCPAVRLSRQVLSVLSHLSIFPYNVSHRDYF